MKEILKKYRKNKQLVHLVLLFIFIMVISFVFVYTNFRKDTELTNEIMYLI